MDSDLTSVDIKKPQKKNSFDFEEFIFNYRKSLTTILGGLILIGVGLIIFKSSSFLDSPKVEILESSSQGPTLESNSDLVTEISGAVQSPGVYKLKSGSRIDDLLIAAGGMSASADRVWSDKYINRASKLTDGQKIYIPSNSEKLMAKNVNNDQNVSGIIAGVITNGLTNINTASQKELEDLPGIGPVYAQSIIENRIYSSVEELLSKGALKKSVYEKLKDKVTVN